MSDLKLCSIYYSATKTIRGMAERLAATGEQIGAEVRLRHVTELAPQRAIDLQESWKFPAASHVTGLNNDIPVKDDQNTALDRLVGRAGGVGNRPKNGLVQ